ncbi:MAG TPA: SusC/RagA family TonB-linked outer membrane protein, partial [Chitinophagaceae bacterium]
TALRKIEKQTKLPFAYKTDDIAPYDNITYEGEEISLAKLLQELLRSTDLSYEQVNTNIVIRKTRREGATANPNPLPTASTRVFDGGIRGRITDEKGEPVANASVQIVGANKGTIANSNGEFVITGLKAGNYKLQVSAIGFEQITKDISVNDNETGTVNLQMKGNAGSMSEVVVTALGISRKERSLGYSTQQVKGENLTFTKDQNVLGSLAGKVAGVQVTGSSGASMGGTQKIKIRGVNSISGSGAPLIVIDGTPISNSNFSGSNANGVDFGNIGQDINNEDVEDISVLKGPTASALYGIRGQYGVIMITTKKGKKAAKKPVISVNSAFSVEKVGNFLPVQNIYGVGNNQTFLTLPGGQKYINGNDESWGPKMDGTPVRMYYSFYPQDPQFGQLTPFVPQPNNIEDFFETGHNINNGVSLTGGGENSTFRLSYNNTYIKGTYPNSHLKRNNIGLNASLQATSKLTIGANVNYANNKGQRPSQGYQGSFTGAVQWFQRNLDIHRLKNYKYADGTIMNWNVNPSTSLGVITNNRPSDWNNPYFDAYENINSDSRDRFFGDVNVSYQLLPDLKVSGFVRGDLYTQKLSSITAFGGRLDEGYAEGKYQNKEINYELLLEYKKRWDNITLNVNVGGNLFNQDYSSISGATAGGLSSPGWYNLAASINRPSVTQFISKKQVRSAYGMVSLGYKDYLFLDASLRNDISSTLPAHDNSNLYPSVSGSFVFSELLKSNILTFGKLRSSFAVAGTDNSPYQMSPIYVAGTTYSGTSVINTLALPSTLRNPNLKPSYANSFEVGADLRFFKSRIGLDVTYYKQVNKDQILPLQVPSGSGYTNALINAGQISNKGIEITLTATPVQTRLIQWNTVINFARNKSMVDELHPDLKAYQLDANTYSSQTIYLFSNEKQPFGSLIGPGYKKDPATGLPLLDASNMPIQELNKNFGSVVPNFTGGFLNTIKVGPVDLNAMIDFQSGGKFFSWSQMLAVKSGQSVRTAAINENGKNVRDPLVDGGGYSITGISAANGSKVSVYVDARTYFRNNIGTRIYDEWLYDASFVKLREVSLGYTFRNNILKKTPFTALRIALIARNPVMIWQKAPKGLDPSELSAGSASISWIEKGELQTVRSFGVNLNVTF